MRRGVTLSLTALVVVVIAALAAVAWTEATFNGPGPSRTETTIVLPPGSSLSAIAARLEQAGIIENRLVFEFGARLRRAGRELQAGEFTVPAGASPAKVLALLRSGQTVQRRLTVPEGLTVVEVVQLVNDAPAMVDNVEPTMAEGSLLPETYSYVYGESRVKLIGRMQDNMQETLAELWPKRRPGLPLATPAEALILASIVEKETAVAAERARIAAVFINRLDRGMRLQSDPTVIYGLTDGKGPLGRALTRADLKSNTPYNTYQIDGLPPGPIANPGRHSIEAVLNPMTSKELYFVADGNGGHVFAETLAEHNRNVQAWRRIQRRRAN